MAPHAGDVSKLLAPTAILATGADTDRGEIRIWTSRGGAEAVILDGARA